MVYTIHYTAYTMQCVYFIVYTMQCIVYNVWSTMYNVCTRVFVAVCCQGSVCGGDGRGFVVRGAATVAAA